MNSRRKFLQLLGLAAPAAALAPKMLESGKLTDIPPPLKPPVTAQTVPGMRYLGLAQLKNEGDLTIFDPGHSHGPWPAPANFAPEDDS